MSEREGEREREEEEEREGTEENIREWFGRGGQRGIPDEVKRKMSGGGVLVGGCDS